jgi:hypothetical protein
MRNFLNSRSRRGRYLAVTLIGLVWSNSICLVTYSAAKTTAINPAVNKLQPEEHPENANSSPANESVDNTIREKYVQLPLAFEANEGQRDSGVRFVSKGNGYSLFLTTAEAVFLLNKPAPRTKTKGALRELSVAAKRVDSTVVKMKLVGADDNPRTVGLDELPGKSNYFIGNDPAKWKTDIPNYSKVKYEQVYQGVDMVYYGQQRQLEYDFVVSPGVDPNVIRQRFEGARGLRIDRNGDLLIASDGGELRMHKPFVYQITETGKQEISSRYQLRRNKEVTYVLGKYDENKALIIDPSLSYSTYLGGGNGDQEADDIVVDGSGNVYVTGFTGATNFPVVNPLQGTNAGSGDIFVTKINAAGSAILYSTYIGGADSEGGSSIALTASGEIVVAGTTPSTNFPTFNALQTSLSGQTDAYVLKLNASGNAFIYSTYLGGNHFNNTEVANEVAVDSNGNAYVIGKTPSSDFPVANAFQATKDPAPGEDGFLSVINSSGSAFIYSTYLGGNDFDDAEGIFVDSSGNAYVVGLTYSSNFPTTAGVYQSAKNGPNDAFITKFNSTGSLVFSTYLGGSEADGANTIAVDASGIYVGGGTGSTDFPVLNPYQSTHAAGTTDDVFITKLNSSATSLIFSTYLGGDDYDIIDDLAVDESGAVFITGNTFSKNYPRQSAIQQTHGGGFRDVFVSKLEETGSALLFSTYLGGISEDMGLGIAIDNSGAYICGLTGGAFPVQNPIMPHNSGHWDAFVTKITGVTGFKISGTITGGGGAPLASATVTLSGSQTGSTQTNASGFYSFSNLASGGNYTVTPSKAPFTFVPTNRTFNNLSAHQTGNFTIVTYSISGRVTNASGAGVGDVTLTLSGHQSGTTQTDANGNYSFPSVGGGGNYTITPSKPDALLTYTFNPTSRSITNLSANTGLIDFTSSVSIITTVNPIGDAYVQDGSAANTNFGTATTMLVRTDNQTNNGLNRDAYLMFDIDGISGTISTVKLRFFAALSQSGSVTTQAYSTTTTWIESGSGSITWNNKPTRTALTGATVVVSGTSFVTYDIDVTTYVRGEKLAGKNRVSLVLHDPSPVTPHFTLNSREAATNKPRLVVTTSATGNAAPAVSISAPLPGASFTAPASIQISSNATDSDGSISNVAYYAGTQFIGSSTTGPSYQITWSGVGAGTYALFAVATDNSGATTTSNPITVNVNPINNPPAVSIESPLPGTIFPAGSNIVLRAKPTDTDGSISKVEFLAGATLVGTATTPDVDNLYSVTWNNVAPGAYALTARATDNASGVTNSVLVNISVVTQTGLSPVFDAYVRDGSSASTNFGTATELQVQNSATAGSNRQAHFRFDLTAVSGIARAKLRLYGKLSDTSGVNVPLAAYAVSDTTWTETGITWNNKPSTGTLQSSTTITDNVARWYEFDVTAHVKGEKDLNHNAVSLAVKALANSTPFATFNSKEANLATDIRPQLIIWTTQARNALLVVGSSNLGVGDNAVKTRLQNLGYTVTAKVANNSLLSTDADGKTVIVISSTVTATSVGTKFRHTSVPVVNWEFDIFDDMGMTGAVANMDLGTSATTIYLNIINSTHALAAGLALGQQQVLNTGSATAFTWGNPTVNAAKIATVVGDANKIVIFGYDGGAAMTGLPAPGRRVGLFMTDVSANSFNPSGGALFDAAIKWATELITKPVINSVTPTLGPAGTTVTVTGINFGATQGASSLKFNGVAASPTSWSDKSIVSAVPLFATTGPLIVTVSGVASNGLVFAVGEIDSDADGLPDNWEIQYFGNLNQTGTGDPDGDGLNNTQEYQQGRNPTKSALADPGDFVNLKVHTPLSP